MGDLGLVQAVLEAAYGFGVGFDARGLEGFTGKRHFFVLLSFGPGFWGEFSIKPQCFAGFTKRKSEVNCCKSATINLARLFAPNA